MRLLDRIREQAAQCRMAGSRLTGALLAGAADDVEAGGPAADLLLPLETDAAGTVPALRFAGAVHRWVLEERAPEVAAHYPSVGGTADVEAVWPAVRRLLAASDLREDVRRPVQTNEVGRSAALYGGLLHVVARTGLPVRLLEVGASAGLNLQVDRFAYSVGSRLLGAPASPVRLVDPWTGALPPPAEPQVVARAGCDPSPLDPRSTDDRRTLLSYVWADQSHRVERLRSALRLAAAAPVDVERSPASAFLHRELSRPADGVVTVVWQSVVWQYLSRSEREAVSRTLEAAGERATRAAPLAYLSLEPDRVGERQFAFRLRLRSWPGGQEDVLADAEGHGPPVRWR